MTINWYEPETPKEKLILELGRMLSDKGYHILQTSTKKLYVPKPMTLEKASKYVPAEQTQEEIVATKAYKDLLYGVYEERKIAVIFTSSIE